MSHGLEHRPRGVGVINIPMPRTPEIGYEYNRLMPIIYAIPSRPTVNQLLQSMIRRLITSRKLSEKESEAILEDSEVLIWTSGEVLEGSVCPISMQTFGLTSADLCVTPCKHVFVHEHLKTWLRDKESCPVCRGAVCEMELAFGSSVRRTLRQSYYTQNRFDCYYYSEVYFQEACEKLSYLTECPDRLLYALESPVVYKETNKDHRSRVRVYTRVPISDRRIGQLLNFLKKLAGFLFRANRNARAQICGII